MNRNTGTWIAPLPLAACRLWLCSLLVLAWIPASAARPALPGEGAFRSRALQVPAEGRTGFQRLLPEQTGLRFTNWIPESRHLTNQLLLDGGGVTAGDVDGDGRVDVFLSGLGGGSALWSNLGGLRFTNTTATAFGAGSPLDTLDATGCVLADLTGDGALDLVVSSHGQGTHVFTNDGVGRFRPLTVLNPNRGGHSIAVADVDGDGWLDLYCVNYRVKALMDMPNARATFKVVQGRTEVATVDGRPVTEPDLTNRFTVNLRGGVEELGEPDRLYLNDSGKGFREVSWTDGAWLDPDGKPLARPPFDWGLSAQFHDLNRDGRPELYVCNDFQSPDRLWWNESTPGKVRFRLAAPGTLRHTSRFSMGVDFADVNGDELSDFLVLDMLSRDPVQRLTQLEDAAPSAVEQGDPLSTPQYEVNTLQLGQPDGTFIEAAAMAGLQASEWSWTPAFLDVDLDGDPDLLITTGQWRAARDLDVAAELRKLRQLRRPTDAELFAARRLYPRLEPPQVAFRNDGGRFRECAAEWGFDHRGVAQGLCLADLDDDGDLDVLINHLNGPASLFRNESSAPRIAVRLVGSQGNPDGIGARVTVGPATRAAELPHQRQLAAGGRYLSSDAPGWTFAATGPGPWTIRVEWPDGRVQTLSRTDANRLHEFHAAGAAPGPERSTRESPFLPWFEDWTQKLAHVHRSEPFDEFARQPLLPRRLATEGPGVAFADLDADGTEELIVTGGHQGSLDVFRIRPPGAFVQWTNVPTSRAQPMVLPWNGRLLVAESGYADGSARGAALAGWPGGKPAMAAGANSVGCLAMTDLEADGRMEIFVGARVIPGAWPREPVSALVTVAPEGFEVRQVLTNVGLVRAAVFADLDRDGDPDLVVAPEWGEPRFLKSESGRLIRWDVPFRFNGTNLPPGSLSGLWNSVNAADLDADGRPDLVLGNWGENSAWALHDRPWVLHHADLDGDGSEDVVTSYVRPGAGARFDPGPSELLPMQGLAVLSAAVPSFRERFRSHRSFAEATLESVLGAEGARARKLAVRWVHSVVLYNHADHLEVRLLPEAAQRSPVFGLAIADWDGDGLEDVFLSQNFFGHNHGLTRDDAGNGLILRGGGPEGLDAVPEEQAFLSLRGEGRAVAVADLDADGRPDFVATQHGGPTRVYRNRSGRPGLRVQLDAGGDNRAGVGAELRWWTGSRAGPVRVVRHGAGHGGVDSAVQVIARPTDGDGELEIAWPGGERVRIPVKADVRGLRVGRTTGVKEER